MAVHVDIGALSQHSAQPNAQRGEELLLAIRKLSSEALTQLGWNEATWQACQQSTYLPEVSDFTKLCYLTLVDGTIQKLPCTEAQLAICAHAVGQNRSTRTGFTYSAIPFAISAALTYTSLLTLSNLPHAVSASIAATCACMGRFAASMIGLKITGINPESSLQAADRKQEAVHLLRREFKELACELVKVHAPHPEVATLVARHIHLRHLRNALASVGFSADELTQILLRFKEAKHYLSKSVLPRSHAFVHYIESECHMKCAKSPG